MAECAYPTFRRNSSAAGNSSKFRNPKYSRNKGVVAYVIGQTAASGVRATGRAIRRLLRGHAAPEVPPEEALNLTPAQWAAIHRIVETTAERGGVASDRARLIADAVTGQGQVG